MDIKRVSHTQPIHNANAKLLISSLENKQTNKKSAPLTVIQLCHAIHINNGSLLSGILPVGCGRDQLSQSRL